MLKATTGTLVCVAIAAVMTASSPDSHATIVRGFSLSGMTATAQSIVRGTVVDQEVVYDSHWGRVYTHTIIEVSEVLWGTEIPGEFVVLRQIGGELDGITSRVVGTAHIEVGDEVVVFARTDGARHYLVGMAQGLYQVDRRAATPLVARGVYGLRLIPQPGPARAIAPTGMTLATLRAHVLATLAVEGRTR